MRVVARFEDQCVPVSCAAEVAAVDVRGPKRLVGTDATQTCEDACLGPSRNQAYHHKSPYLFELLEDAFYICVVYRQISFFFFRWLQLLAIIHSHIGIPTPSAVVPSRG